MRESLLACLVVVLAACECGGGAETDGPGLSLASVEPDSGPVTGGTSVLLHGTGFENVLEVRFGGIPASSVEVLSETLASAVTPAAEGPGLVDVGVAAGESAAVLPEGFDFIAAPRVEAVDPPSGSARGGTEVLVRGEGFVQAARVWFGGAELEAAVLLDEGTIAGRTPPGAPGLVDVTVENPDGQRGVGEDAFEYLEGIRCRVVETSPAFGATGVEIVADVVVRWSEPIDVSTTADRVALETLDGTAVAATIEADGPEAVRLRPLLPLRFWGHYAVVVDEGVASASGQECEGASVAFSTVVPSVGERDLRPSAAHGLAVVGDVTFTASPSSRGLQAWDISTPLAPVLVDELLTDAGPVALTAGGDRLYAPAGYDGTLIIDVSDPADLVLLGRAGSPGYAADATAFDRAGIPYLAIADGVEGVRLLEVLDPEAARDLGAIDPSEARAADVRAVSVGADLLAIANGALGFAIASIEDIGAPTLLARVQTIRTVTDVLLDGSILYVAEGYAGIVSYDVSDPSTPVPVDTALDECEVQCVDNITSLSLFDSTLYGAAARGGVYRLALDDVGGLQVDAQLRTSGQALRAVPTADALLVGEEGGLAVFAPGAADGATPDFFDPSGRGLVRDVLVLGDFLYAAASTRGLQIFSLDRPDSPDYLGRRDSPGSLSSDISAFSVAVADSTLILGDGRAGLTLYSVADPADPVQSYNVPARDRIAGLAVRESIVFACDDNYGVLVVDLSNADAPEEVAYLRYQDISPADQCYDLLVAGDYLFMASRQFLSVLDATDPSQLRLLGQYSLRADDAVLKLAVSGTTLLAATMVADFEARFGRTHRLQLFDLTDPERPERLWVGEDLGGSTDVAAAGPVGFVSAADRGIYVFDLSDPRAPFLEGIIATPANATGLSVGTEQVYVAGAEGGVLAVMTGRLPLP